MTELEEAELTDGQGRALSGRRAQTACAGYAKRMLARALPAAPKRYARMIATGNAAGTAVQMWRGMAFGMTGERMTSLLPDLLRWLRNPRSGGVSRVAKGADCKSAALWLRRFESCLPHHHQEPEVRYQSPGRGEASQSGTPDH
jgi:hypothetical protein